MAADLERTFLRVRSEQFEWDPLRRDLITRAPFAWTPAQARQELARAKAWKNLCGMLTPEGVAGARAAGMGWVEGLTSELAPFVEAGAMLSPPVVVDSAEKAVVVGDRVLGNLCAPDGLRTVSSRAAPWRPTKLTPWGVYAEATDEGKQLPDELLDRLLSVITGLVAAFLVELERISTDQLNELLKRTTPVEGRRPGYSDPNGGPAHVLQPGLVVQDTGHAIGVVFDTGAASTETRSSPVVYGPVVIEHVALWSDGFLEGSVQVRVIEAGAVAAVAMAASDALGDSLISASGTAGFGQAELPWVAFPDFVEFWPRRLVKRSTWRLQVTVRNTFAGVAWFGATVSYRDIRAAA